jgi:hypothetical protein
MTIIRSNSPPPTATPIMIGKFDEELEPSLDAGVTESDGESCRGGGGGCA